MKFNIAALAVVLVASCLAGHAVWADDGSGDDKPRSTELTKAQKERIAKQEKEALARRKTAPKVKFVSLNSASVAELKALPGITDKEALQIVAGRPYGSKAWLVTKGVLDPLIYQSIKSLVVAGQPSKSDAAKLPEVFGRKP
jgi:DNA uptake protein ComE-like DNA-binding protein